MTNHQNLIFPNYSLINSTIRFESHPFISPSHLPFSSSRQLPEKMFKNDLGINQQPLMVHFSSSAIQQMQGQQSLSMEVKYLRQSMSAGMSDPFSWAAF
jgi:hypothetical protein